VTSLRPGSPAACLCEQKAAGARLEVARALRSIRGRHDRRRGPLGLPKREPQVEQPQRRPRALRPRPCTGSGVARRRRRGVRGRRPGRGGRLRGLTRRPRMGVRIPHGVLRRCSLQVRVQKFRGRGVPSGGGGDRDGRRARQRLAARLRRRPATSWAGPAIRAGADASGMA
jgi:hypothetical protein